MKRLIKKWLCMFFPALVGVAGGESAFAEPRMPDFDFPQKECSIALKDLKGALKSGDGDLTVDALVRFSIAKSMISRETMDTIVMQVEKTIAQEKKPDTKAMLCFLEAMIYSNYDATNYRHSRRLHVIGEDADDETEKTDEMDRQQLRQKAVALVMKAVSDPGALNQCPITAYKRTITGYDETGRMYCPTLLHFLAMRGLDLIDDYSGFSSQIKQLKELWLNASGSTEAKIFAERKIGGTDREELYEKYKDNAHSGIFLESLGEYKSNYPLFKDYVARHPQGYYTADIQRKINSMESKKIRVSAKDEYTSTDTVKVDVNVDNLSEFTVNIYRVPDKYLDKDNSVAYSYDKDGPKIADFVLAASKTLRVEDGPLPFERSCVAVFEPLPYGVYVISGAFINEGKKVELYMPDRGSDINVHDMTMMTVGARTALDDGKEGSENQERENIVLVVDALTGKGVPGATVEVTYDKQTTTYTTDSEGCVALPYSQKNGRLRAVLGKDKYGPTTYYNKLDGTSGLDYTTVDIFTDLSIYRPGETVQFALLAHRTLNDKQLLLKDRKLKVTFSDTNWKEVGTAEVTTDDTGRATGSFVVPTDRMNGSFHLVVENNEPRTPIQQLASKNISVSEYKTPTFQVTFDNERYAFNANQPVVLRGKVETYSGMPLADTEVKLSLFRQRWEWNWWMMGVTKTNIGTPVVKTDADGRFEYTVEEGIIGRKLADGTYKRYADYTYSLTAACTNAAGETQEAEMTFIVCGKREVKFTSDKVDHDNAKGKVTMPIILNTTDVNEKWANAYYRLLDSGKNVVSSGSFRTDKPEFDFTALPSGLYTMYVDLLDTKNDDYDSKCTLVLYRRTDASVVAVNSKPFWLPKSGQWVDDKNVAHVLVAVPESNMSHIYYIVANDTRVVKHGWLHYKPGYNEFAIPFTGVPGEKFSIEFAAVRDKTTADETVSLASNVKAEALKVKATAFRDKLVPGKTEKWEFTLEDQNGNPATGFMFLEMMDKAIDDLSGNRWGLRLPLWSVTTHSLRTLDIGGWANASVSWTRSGDYGEDAKLPVWNFYDNGLFGGYQIDMLNSAMGGRAYYAKDARHPNMRFAEPEMALAEESMSVDGSDEANENALKDVQLRMSDVKVALWRPLLKSTPDGKITVEFEAPQFNTTWIVQGLAVNDRLRSSHLWLNVLTQKPLMVKSGTPRFLRQGDKATLAATLQNASDKAFRYSAVIELFNPRNGEVIKTQKFAADINSKATDGLSIDWQVPDTLPFVGFRVKAANTEFGDGEQVIIPILPSISPVIESKPFYIEPGQANFTMQLPEVPQNARVTLEYCDNPVWYCVTALPTIYSENYEVSTSLAHSLYAQTLAKSIAASQPMIREAITQWNSAPDDSTLVSMLAKNRDLKVGTLLASPWINEADRQTLQMSKLNTLFDPQIQAKEYERIIKGLQGLQMSDGGWTWFKHPDCKSSLWATHTVLELIGELKHLGCLADDSAVNDMVAKAIKYYDAEQLKLFNEQVKRDKKNHSGFSSYVYVRTLFKEYALPKANASMIKKCLKAMEKDWKGTSISNKAFFALTLNRNGKAKLAQSIVESIRQFAMTKPELGMYWDNLNNGWGYSNPVAVTSVVLQAMNEVDPRREELDLVRKWMLLMKQTNDWGSSSLAADAVYSLLSTGSQWLTRGGDVDAKVAGQQVVPSKTEAYLGYWRKTVPAKSLATLDITRTDNSQSPAWGAVYTQYTAPMTELKAAAVDEISIDKEIYVFNAEGTLSKAQSFKVGDKVMVRLVIKNNRDLDYVTVHDERGACFEPTDVKSGYRSGDDTFFYLETKDSETNLFFNHLSKGTHIVGYEARVTMPGEFSVGIATAQSQQAAQVTAHSAGKLVTVTK